MVELTYAHISSTTPEQKYATNCAERRTLQTDQPHSRSQYSNSLPKPMAATNIAKYGSTQSAPADRRSKPNTSVKNDGISDMRVKFIHPLFFCNTQHTKNNILLAASFHDQMNMPAQNHSTAQNNTQQITTLQSNTQRSTTLLRPSTINCKLKKTPTY
jgi:hypothetical protein